MAALIWDEQEQAFTEAETPMKYDPSAGAWTDTTGLAYNPDAEAWEEKWSPIVIVMPDSISSGYTPNGSTGTVTSESIDISKFKRLSGKWDVNWFELSTSFPNYQQGYGTIVADGVVIFNTGNCTFSNRDDTTINGSHGKSGTFSVDISSYNLLCVKATATASYSNWYHYFTIKDLVWEK